jgi:hypothetical protein
MEAGPLLGGTLDEGDLTLSWPLSAAGFALQLRTNLTEGGWKPVSTAPQIIGDEWQIVVPASASEQYFRLQR